MSISGGEGLETNITFEKEFIYKCYECKCSRHTSCGEAIPDAPRCFSETLRGSHSLEAHTHTHTHTLSQRPTKCKVKAKAKPRPRLSQSKTKTKPRQSQYKSKGKAEAKSRQRQGQATNVTAKQMSRRCKDKLLRYTANAKPIKKSKGKAESKPRQRQGQPTNATAKQMSSRGNGQATRIHQRKEVLEDAIRCL